MEIDEIVAANFSSLFEINLLKEMCSNGVLK